MVEAAGWVETAGWVEIPVTTGSTFEPAKAAAAAAAAKAAAVVVAAEVPRMESVH
jgi:hypothetical protein